LRIEGEFEVAKVAKGGGTGLRCGVTLGRTSARGNLGATEWRDMGEGALSDMASPYDLDVAGEGNKGGGAGPADVGA
jgi:hypothetical protein